MPVTLEILTEPIGSIFVQSIGSNDRADLNDFAVYIVSSENATGMEQSDLSASSGSSIVSFEGRNSVWKAMIRPQTMAGTVTLTVAQNAVSEGNPETSKTIRVSTSFPDTDAENATLLFNTGQLSHGITISPTHILILVRHGAFTNSPQDINFYTHAGVDTTVTSPSRSLGTHYSTMEYFNGSVFVRGNRYNLDFNLITNYTGLLSNRVHTRLGIVYTTGKIFRSLAYRETDTVNATEVGDLSSNIPFTVTTMAHQNDLIYVEGNDNFGLVRITENDEVVYVANLNIDVPVNTIRDIAIYRNTFYISVASSVYTLDIRKYRPLDINTKTNIPIQFANEGDTIDLEQFCPDAERIIFDTGADKPPYLSINSANQLEIASSAVTETTPVFLPLRAINRIDSQPFSFYLVIRQASAPKWRDTPKLTMHANSSIDLFHLLETESGFDTPTTIEYRSGKPRLVGSRLSNGVFRISTVGGGRGIHRSER